MPAFADYVLTRVPQSTDGALLTLSSPTTAIAAATKDASQSVSIGFSFPYAGTSYTAVEVTSDGTLLFAGGTANQYRNDEFDDANTAVMLAPWWDYLITSPSGHVRYQTVGAAPNRYFVVEWDCWGGWNHNASANVRITFQVVLRETSGNIEFRYGRNIETGSPNYSNTRATVGARVATATTITGNIREFSEVLGTAIANGGVDAPVVASYLSPEPGQQWPGDPTNTIEGLPFNFHFTPPAADAPELVPDPTGPVTDPTEAWVYSRAQQMFQALLPGNRADEEQRRILMGTFIACAYVMAASRNEILGVRQLLDPARAPARFLPYLGHSVGLTPDTGIPGHLTTVQWRSLIPQMGEALRRKGTSYRALLFGVVGRPVWIGYWHDLRHQLEEDDPLPLLGYDAAEDGVNAERTVTIHVPDPFGNYAAYTPAEGEVAVNRDLVGRLLDLVRPNQQRLDVFYYDWVDDLSQGVGRWEVVSGSDLGHDAANMLMTVPVSTEARVLMGDVGGQVEYAVWEAWVRMDAAAGYEIRVRWASGGDYYSLLLTPNAVDPAAGAAALTHSTAGAVTSGTATLPLEAWVLVQITCAEVPAGDDHFVVAVDGDEVLTGTLASQSNKGPMGVVTPAGGTLDVRLVEQYQPPATRVRVGPAT